MDPQPADGDTVGVKPRTDRAFVRCAVLLGTPVDDVTMEEALDRIGEMVDEGRKSGRVHQVVTVNVDFVVNAARDSSLRSILQRSDLSIPDGMGIVWGAKFIGVPIRTRTSGVDLVPALVERARDDGWRVCLFGAGRGVAERAAQVLRDRYPGADVVGLDAPTIGTDGEMTPGTARQLQEMTADVVGVALGNPKQERWIDRHGAAIGAPVYVGVGGSLDFLTGVTRRAPAWMQRAGFEWIHRAVSEPRRLVGRYAKDILVYVPGVIRQALRGRRLSPSATVTVERFGGIDVIDVRASMVLDNSVTALLVGRLRDASRHGRSAVIVGLTRGMRENAVRLGLDEFLDEWRVTPSEADRRSAPARSGRRT